MCDACMHACVRACATIAILMDTCKGHAITNMLMSFGANERGRCKLLAFVARLGIAFCVKEGQTTWLLD